MRFKKIEREITWSILHLIGSDLNLPLNTVLTDAFILICKYNNYSIEQKKSGQINSDQLKAFKNGKLYKIIASSVFLASKMNDNSKTLDDIFASIFKSIQSLNQAKINVDEIIEFSSNEYEKNFIINKNGNIELTDSFKHELVCVYEILILNSIDFSPVIKWNPFRFIKILSKKLILGNFQICERVAYFVLMILKDSKFLSIPVHIVVAAATDAAYECSKSNSENDELLKKVEMPQNVEEWIKLCKSQNFLAFENATSLLCSTDS